MAFDPKQSRNTVILQDEDLRKLRGFIQIPRVVLMHKAISYGAKVAYGILLGYAWQDEFCFPAQAALAGDLNCSVRQAQRLLEELKKSGLITWKQQGLNKPNIYYLLSIPDHISEKNMAKNKDTTNMSRPDTTYLSGQEATNMSHYLYSSNNTQITVNRSPNKIHELPVINQPEEKTRYIAEHILEKLGLSDQHSKKFHYLVASHIPEFVIHTNLAEIIADGAENPARLFTYRMTKYAEEKLGMSAEVDQVQERRANLASSMQI